MQFHGVEFIARGITARGARGCAFSGVSLDIERGALAVVAGPAGCGRTSLLLALSGRMRLVAGSVSVGGHRLPTEARRVRQLVSTAQAQPALGLDDELRVGELVAERTMIGGPNANRTTVAEAFDLLGIDVAANAVVADLPADERTLLAVALAAAEQPSAVVVDDVESGCDPAQYERVWAGLWELAARGCTVLAATTIVPAAPMRDAITVLELPHPTVRDRIPAQKE